MSKATEALQGYIQQDEEGVMVLTSRQAIHEVISENERLRAALSAMLSIDVGPCDLSEVAPEECAMAEKALEGEA